MVADRFEKLIETFDPLNKEQLTLLEEWTQNYPFFPTPWAYLAKAAQAQKKIDAERITEQAAIHAFNRAAFKDWLEIENKGEKESIKTPAKEKTTASRSKKSFQKKALQTKSSNTRKKRKPTTKTATDNPSMRSFLDWLDHSNGASNMPQKDLKSSKNQEQKKDAAENKWELIDAFIENNPKINNPSTIAPLTDLASQQQLPKEELMTETLAKILMQQHKYSKALQAYKILSLKYPEKNTFFASQIKEIKRLQQAKQ